MAWVRPNPQDYTVKPGLEGELLAPRTGTIEFRIAQCVQVGVDKARVFELLPPEDAQKCIDAGRHPKTGGLIPWRGSLFYWVCERGEQG
jgi:hypothetical protein